MMNKMLAKRLAARKLLVLLLAVVVAPSAMAASSGDIRWSSLTGGAVNSSPAVANNAVFVGSNDGKVYALDAVTGAVIWATVTGAPVDSSPAIANGLLYIGSDNSRVYAMQTVDDSDGDNVADRVDACPNTIIPESVPTLVLKPNQYALTSSIVSSDGLLYFQSSSNTKFTTADTRGCSCEQIVAALGLGNGALKFGCSKSQMRAWILGLR
ncbi:MAG: PQQ-binding-like beta-propeller repeat protein [Woeseiaceae bacterium]|nr:PQQ-binding-like beta-propeller repeat protein [Woeseiaceae bacterium]